jgi:hypothetical protein
MVRHPDCLLCVAGFCNTEHFVKWECPCSFTNIFESFEPASQLEVFEVWHRGNKFVGPRHVVSWVDRQQVGHAAFVMENP